LAKAAAWFARESDPIRVFQFMSANQAFFAIATMARVLGVSTAGYYAWRSRRRSARAIADDALLRRVRTIHAFSRGTRGVPRVHAELRAGAKRRPRASLDRLLIDPRRKQARSTGRG
jgi:putative transposase